MSREGFDVIVVSPSFDDALGSNEFTAAYGQELDSGWGYSTALHVKNGNRTILPFETADGSVSVYQDNSPTHTVWFDTKISYGDFEFSTLIEKYDFVHQESFLQVPQAALEMKNGYDRFDWGLDYNTEINEQWSVNASFLYQETMAHDMVVTESRDNDLTLGSHYRVNTERTIAALDATYTISENSSVSFGVEKFEVDALSLIIGEYFVDPGHGIPGDSSEFTDVWFLGNKSYTLDQSSAFVQYENYNDIVNFTVGVRFADHSHSAEKVTVPRIGLSKSWGDFGAKLMYSEAFRTGDAEHVSLFSGEYKGQPSDQLKPETLDSTEIEIHYLHETGMYTLNYFQMNVEDSIVWNTAALTENSGEMVTSGFEGAWIGKGDGYEQELNFAYYEAGSESVPSQLSRSGDSFIGFPTLKITYRLDYELSEETTISPSIMYEGEKYWRRDAGDISQDIELDPTFKLNLAVTHKLNDNFEVLLAVHDMLDDGYYFPQAYGQVNYPGDSREFSLSMEYTF
jgi:outer membrane receptor for ferrienterochelin and colicin